MTERSVTPYQQKLLRRRDRFAKAYEWGFPLTLGGIGVLITLGASELGYPLTSEALKADELVGAFTVLAGVTWATSYIGISRCEKKLAKSGYSFYR